MKRLDLFLLENNFYQSREKAKEAVKSGRVKVDGAVVLKPAQMISLDAKVEALPFEFVSRGGFKLQKAVEEFNINLKDKVVVDIGASTGGFTDVCLKCGAKKVYAIDTGSNQLAQSIKENKNVVNMSNTNYLEIDKIADADVAVIDVSFVSLTKFALKLSNEFKEIVALIKPQFEVGLQYAKKHNGIVKDKNLHNKIIKDITDCFTNNGFEIVGVIPSPILGGDGNTEFLMYAKNKNLI